MADSKTSIAARTHNACSGGVCLLLCVLLSSGVPGCRERVRSVITASVHTVDVQDPWEDVVAAVKRRVAAIEARAITHELSFLLRQTQFNDDNSYGPHSIRWSIEITSADQEIKIEMGIMAGHDPAVSGVAIHMSHIARLNGRDTTTDAFYVIARLDSLLYRDMMEDVPDG